MYNELWLSQHRVTRHIVQVGLLTKVPIVRDAFPLNISFLSRHLQVVISHKSACFSRSLLHKTTKIPLCKSAFKKLRFGIGFIRRSCQEVPSDKPCVV